MAAREAQEFAESIIQTVRQPLIVLDGELHVVTANQSFYHLFHLSPSKVERHLFYSIGEGEWNIPELRQLLEEVLPQSSSFQNFEVDHTFAGIGRRIFVLNARRLERKSGDLGLILLALEDMTLEHIHKNAPVSGHDGNEHE
jgi:PAS domain-containing protein